MQRLLIELLAGGGTLLVIGGFATCLRLLKRIQESERKYRLLVESANVAIFVADGGTGRMIESNRSGEMLLGAPARQFIGTVCPLLPETGSAEGFWKEFVASLHSGNGQRITKCACGPRRRVVPVEVSANLVRIRRPPDSPKHRAGCDGAKTRGRNAADRARPGA